MTNFNKLFESFQNTKIGVVGDIMLDTYWWGHVERISPEAPVPVVSLDKKEYRIGGAGNVAMNLASLRAQVTSFAVIGNDDEATILKQLLAKNNIHPGYMLSSPSRITTNKARIISRNQQMMRLDSETTQELSAEDETKILQSIKTYIEKEKPQMIIFEDYNKGVLTENVIGETIKLCQTHHVFTAVDPKRKNFFTYKGVDIFKPNLKEVKEGLNLLIDQINLETMGRIHEQLAEKLNHQISLITLSICAISQTYQVQGIPW
jgi:D-glycero-beta-D-manno-heptose-7-phosphate kinase